jgi:SAM-dependent methyltransferase
VRGGVVEFVAARSVTLPFKNDSFDLVIASDGLYSWDLPRNDRAASLLEIHRVVRSGGVAILTEHMRPRRFAEFVGEIRNSPLHVESVSYFHDRLAYQFESWFRGVPGWSVAKALRRSTHVARVLSRAGRLFGQRGARHICVIARKA